MWRHWSRGIQKGFRKHPCLEQQDNFSKGNRTNAANLCCITKLLPRSLQHLDPCTGRRTSEDKKGRPKDENATRNFCNHTFLEAFGWSGVLAVGWVISKQWWLKQTWVQDRESYKKNQTIVHYQGLLEILACVVKTQPPANYVLPIPVPLKKFPTENKKEDKFEAAAKELQEIHQKSIGKALNRRGISHLSKSAGAEAIKYFKRASELNYPPASFNMGQCCELGIGIKQDFKQAAEWYKLAADQGHSTAMYNLGVFYAHGWGGLQSDIKLAKKLFVQAAELGQPDAKIALIKESAASSNLIYQVKNSQILNGQVISNPVKVQTELDLFVNKITYELADSVFKRDYSADNNWDIPFKSSVIF